MKKFLVLLFLITIFGCKSKKVIPDVEIIEPTIIPTIVVLNSNEINTLQKEKAYNYGKRILNTCNTSRFKPFSRNEATDKVIANTTSEKITKTCQVFRWKYGEFKGLKLAEVIKNNFDCTVTYRFKAEYQRKFEIKELRVTFDENNKLSAIKSMNWKNEF